MENRAAKSREKYDDDDVGCSGSDRISRLPDPVLHHILCFLSQKKAVQTSVLSKSWRHLGPTRPVIDLHGACRNNDLGHWRGVCENCFCGKKEAFLMVLEKTFERYHKHNLFPHQLILHMLEDDSQSISVLEKWIPIFINPDNPVVTTFSLSFNIGPYSKLPSVVFKSEYLRELHLHWCRLNDIDSIGNVQLKNLEKLSLFMVHIAAEVLEEIISGCPLVKRLVINFCFNTRLVNRDNFAHSIAINAPTLESIRIERASPTWYPINSNNNNFPHLKSLFLSDVTLSTDSFHYFSGNFPCLQELSILYCFGFDEINISSCSIKRLIIHETTRSPLKKVAIEVSNILFFEHFNSILRTTLSLTTTSSRQRKSHSNFYQYKYDSEDDVLKRILKLFEMVKALSRSQISLIFHDTDLCFKTKQWDFSDHPVEVENLGLNISEFCPDSLARVLNALFRIFRPKYTNAVCVRRKNDEEVTKFLWKTLISERGKTEYGWEQHLEKVSIEASNEKGKVWNHVQWTCLPEWSMNQKIRFRLKWRD